MKQTSFSLSLTQLSIIINTAVLWLTWQSDRVSWLRYVYNLSVTSKLLADSRQWSKLHFSLSHHNETIHHHQHISFWTSTTVGWSFSTRIWRLSKCRVSLLSFLIFISHQRSSLNILDESNFTSLSLTQLSIIINTAVFWLTWQSDRVSWLTYKWSFSFWCHDQGQPWRRGSSVSFLILMSYQSRSLIVFYEYLSPQRNYSSSSTQQFSD